MKAYIKPRGNNRFFLTMPSEHEPGPYRGVCAGDKVKFRNEYYKIVRSDSCYDGKLIYIVDTVKL